MQSDEDLKQENVQLQAEVKRMLQTAAMYQKMYSETKVERDALKAEAAKVKAQSSFWHESSNKAIDAMTSVAGQRDTLQSELTKARQCIANVLGLLRADKSTHAQHAIIRYQGVPTDEFAHQSAPAAKASSKICIECGEPYCHGVCVERGDDDEDYLSRVIRDGDQP